MKSVVYYFTGTGNSLVVANDIAKEIGGKVVSISSQIGNESINTDEDVIGFVFPVYIWGVPLIVKRFIKKLDNLKDKYIFAIATYGGMPGATIELFDNSIKESGGKLAGGFTVQMPPNYIPMSGAVDKEKQQKIFCSCSKRIADISEYIKNNGQGVKEKSNPFYNLIFSHIVYNMSSKYIPKMDKDFWADEKCNRCGICQKVCPVNNIEIADIKPVWKGKCEQCFACLQWCPQEAIQYGKKTASRKRYHHPDIQVTDLIKKTSDKVCKS